MFPFNAISEIKVEFNFHGQDSVTKSEHNIFAPILIFNFKNSKLTQRKDLNSHAQLFEHLQFIPTTVIIASQDVYNIVVRKINFLILNSKSSL